MRHKFETEDFQKGIKIIKYEINMLKSLACILALDSEAKGIIHNALLESFLVHARNLIEFLYKNDSNWKDDILAADYFSDPDNWEKIRGAMPILLKETKKDADTYLAHISLARLATPDEKRWPIDEITEEIVRMLDVFYKHQPQ